MSKSLKFEEVELLNKDAEVAAVSIDHMFYGVGVHFEKSKNGEIWTVGESMGTRMFINKNFQSEENNTGYFPLLFGFSINFHSRMKLVRKGQFDNGKSEWHQVLFTFTALKKFQDMMGIVKKGMTPKNGYEANDMIKELMGDKI